MRRVRCDLKDLPVSKAGRHPSCSNCKERGLKCVDEYGQVKSVKLLRRGRRLQQAEAVYGKVKAGEEDDTLLIGPSPPPNVTPLPTSAFFDSQFWRRFQLQRPVIEPHEFVARFIASQNGKSDSLGITGRLLAMALVVWASSFGIDENGQPLDPLEDHIYQYQERKVDIHDQFDTDASAKLRTERRTRTNEMVKEMLYLIDVHGILRKPSWDGVRILLMILPLAQDVQSNLERLAMYESTINLIYALTSIAAVSSVNSGKGEYVDALVRARIFWSGILHDWMVNGLRGGRMFLNDFDLGLFEETLPPLDPSNSRADVAHLEAYSMVYRYFTLPLQLASACRLVHTAVTGPEARRKNMIDEERLQRAWGILDKAWSEVDQIRSSDLSGTAFTPQEIEAYIASWKIFMFECNNIIREALKQRLDKFGLITDRSLETPSHEFRGIIQRLYSIAQSKCHYLVRTVGTLIKQHLGTSFFQYDAFQIRDGVFFAGLLLANDGIGSAEDINLCISALREMRWAYSKSEEREQSIRMVWQAKGSGARHEPTPIIPSSFPASFPAPAVGHFRTAMHPRIEVPVLTSAVSSGSSSDEPHWPGSAVSNSDASSPGSFHHGLRSPTTESTRQLHVSGTPPLPATSEGYPTPTHNFVPQPEVSHYFDQFTYPHPTGKGSPFDPDASPTMYYSQDFNNPTVTNFFPDSSLPPIPGASASYPTTQFYYSGN